MTARLEELPRYDRPPHALDRPETATTAPPVLADLSARFWAKVRSDGPLDDPRTCWLYEGQPSREVQGVAPIFTVRSTKHIPVARVAYELTGHGSTAGARLVIACGQAACCRPRHVTRQPYNGDYARGAGWSRGVAEIVAGELAACRPHARFEDTPAHARAAEPPPERRKPLTLSSPRVPSDRSPDRSIPNAPANAAPAVAVTRAAFAHYMNLPGFVAGTYALGTTHVFTPWGGHYEDADWETAVLLAIAHAPAKYRPAALAAA
jgi:hypothetical protein